MRSPAILCIAIAACAAGGAAPAFAQPRPVARAADVFAWPLSYDFGTVCDGRFRFRKDPSFGEGLVARYTLGARPGFTPLYDALKLPGFRFQRQGRGVIAYDSTVLRSHDDLIRQFGDICSSGTSWMLEVRDIAWFPATAAQRRASPPEPVPAGPLAHVRIARDAGFLPEPAANGSIVFDELLPARYLRTEWLPLRPDFGAGLGTVYVFEGRDQPHYFPTLVAKFDAQGFTVVAIDQGGKSLLLIVDRQPVTTREQMQARALIPRELDEGPWFKLERIVYYPAARPGIDDLRLPEATRAALRAQFTAANARYQAELLEMAQRMPDGSEIEAILSSGWADTKDRAGFDGDFNGAGSSFGEVHDYRCTRDALIFTCTVGVTFLMQGRPKYEQREFQFTREGYKLVLYEPEIIVIN
jgi:hypothetical protein